MLQRMGLSRRESRKEVKMSVQCRAGLSPLQTLSTEKIMVPAHYPHVSQNNKKYEVVS